MITEKYQVSCEEFEGPHDLLLYLIRKQEVSINEISISKITKEYLLFIEGLDRIDFDGAGEFIRYASTLLAIKARELSREEGHEEEEDDYETRKSLIRQLELYRLFKGKGQFLQAKLNQANRKFTRSTEETGKEIQISLNGLKERLEDIKKEEPYNPPTTILFHIEHIIKSLKEKLQSAGRFLFSQFVKNSRGEPMVGAFFALLEIVRRGEARASQEEPFGEITVERRED